VDPERTTFGLSSISKVFTTIAVLRLAEQERLALDDLVYRHVPLPALATARGQRVRIAHLLTHTGGFDERTIGIAARTPSDITPLSRYLTKEMPPVVREPGETASYSNHGFALAGLLVERVSGEPFAAYLRQQVFDPLGMRSSGFEQPLAGELEGARALPYRPSRSTPIPRIYFNDTPSGAMYSTGGDMARFMTAFLADSSSSLGTVLRTTAPMRERRFSHHAALNGLTFGFRERSDAGLRGLQQGGDWDDYTSDLILAPTARRGVFVAMSGDGASAIADSIWRYHLLEQPPPGDIASATRDTTVTQSRVDGNNGNLAGTYRLNRYSRRTLAKVGLLTGAIGETVVSRRGSAWFLGQQALTPAALGLYHRGGGSDVAFRFDDTGRATHLFTGGAPYVAYERVEWYERRWLHLALLGITFVALLGTLWRAIVKWPLSRSDTYALRAWRWMMTAAAAGATWLIVGLLATLMAVSLNEFQYGTPVAVQIALAGGLVCIAAAPVSFMAGAAAMVRVNDSIAQRLGRVCLAVAAVVFGTLVWYWRLLPMFA
jgi:CubicO group peptidase (beta-lactamase class C family)